MMLLIKLAMLVALARMGRANLSFSQVQIDDGGYIGLVIAIHPDVEESEELINATKESWIEASKDLFVATGNRAYFKEIKILVPKTWTNVNYDIATGGENYDQADVIIAAPNPSYGNEPYTNQHEGCGQRGIRTHYTPAYLQEDKSIQDYGRRGKVIVHEWAHYRWGIFDETSEENPFYWDPRYGPSSAGPTATTCPSDVTGEIIDVGSAGLRRCDPSTDLDQQTNMYPKNCVFVPFADQYFPIDSSIMAYHYLENVVTFCKDADDEDSDKHNVHNKDAPNTQNRICGMDSVWTVIKNSSDYSFWNVKSEGTVTEPDFKIIQPPVQRFVLVLDDSGSMDYSCGDTTRTECLKKAARRFIQCAPDDSYVGIVSFGTDSKLERPLTLLDSDAVREDLANSFVNLHASSGGTCISCGITTGIEALEKDGADSAGGQLIVITDGDETVEPWVIDVRDNVISKAIILDTIFITNENNLDLKNLTEETGGISYLVRTQSSLNEIFNKLCSTDSTADNSYLIHSAAFDVSIADYESSALIDATIGADTLFAFTWSKGQVPPTIYITSPTGCIYSNDLPGATNCTGGSTSHTVTVPFSTIEFHIPGVASIGKWTYRIDKQTGLGDMTSLVTSAAANDATEPILIETGMSQTDVSSGAPTIYAMVTQGFNPVLGASVVATVTGPGLHEKYIDLYDNGAGSDIRKDDGIYSRYFTEFTGVGRYAVDITLRNTDSSTPKSKRQRSDSRSSANYRPGVVMSNGTVYINPNGAISNEGNTSASMDVQSEDLGEFMRIVPSESFDYTGSVNVESGVAAPDEFPPSKITDLRMHQSDMQDYTQGVVIQFTATGDDFDQGTAAGYEFRYTYGDPTSLITSFTSNKMIHQSNVTKGNFSDPASSGQIEEFFLQTPELPTDTAGNVVSNSRLAFAIRACDSVPNWSDPSNVAVINFFIAPLAITSAPPTTDQQTTAAPATTTVRAETTASVTSVATTTKTTTKVIECVECIGCESERIALVWASSALAVTTAIFLTSTLILSIWLAKSNKQLAKVTKSETKGRDNLGMYDMGSAMKLGLPKVRPSTSLGTPNPYDF